LEPFHCTCDVATNPLPVTDSVKAPELNAALDGCSVDATGVGLEMIANDKAPESPPPGVGLNTVTVAVPEVLRSAAVIAAVNCAELTYVVARFDPFHCTCDDGRNAVPVTLSVNPPEPATAAVGAMTVADGAGFPIVKLRLADVPPPGAGLLTVTAAIPALARSVAVTAAVNCVELTYVVVRAALFQNTCDAAVKPPPVTVKVSDPALMVADTGMIEASTGSGLLVIVNDAGKDVPPPGVAFTTVTLAAPTLARLPAGIVAVSCVAPM